MYFNPRAPCGARLRDRRVGGQDVNFNPRAPQGARPSQARDFVSVGRISTHAPLAGRDTAIAIKRIPPTIFQPTRPLRGATPACPTLPSHSGFQPTRPLRGATGLFVIREGACGISTHAPLAGRDPRRSMTAALAWHFNPRAPCGARPPATSPHTCRQYFNPRAPCGARRPQESEEGVMPRISTHAPLAGRDGVSTSCGHTRGISTHAPLAGRDPPKRATTTMMTNFNPRAPCGARPSTSC